MKILGIIFRSIIEVIRCFFFCIYYYPRRKTTSRLVRYNKIKDIITKENRHLRVNLIVSGQENLPSDQSYLITPNHQGIMDTLVLFECFEDPISYVAKNELSKIPFVKKIIPTIDGYFLERDNLRQEIKVMKNVQKSLKNDNIKWIIFPEGSRTKNPDFKMNDFKAGTFKFPMAISKKIVPCAIYGTSYVFNRHVHKKKYNIYVHFFEPLTPEMYKNMNTQEVASYAQKLIQDKVDEFIRIENLAQQ